MWRYAWRCRWTCGKPPQSPSQVAFLTAGLLPAPESAAWDAPKAPNLNRVTHSFPAHMSWRRSGFAVWFSSPCVHTLPCPFWTLSPWFSPRSNNLYVRLTLFFPSRMLSMSSPWYRKKQTSKQTSMCPARQKSSSLLRCLYFLGTFQLIFSFPTTSHSFFVPSFLPSFIISQ